MWDTEDQHLGQGGTWSLGGEQGRARGVQGAEKHGAQLGAGREHISDWLRLRLKGQLPKLWGQTVPGVKDRPQEPQGDGGLGTSAREDGVPQIQGTGQHRPMQNPGGTLRTVPQGPSAPVSGPAGAPAPSSLRDRPTLPPLEPHSEDQPPGLREIWGQIHSDPWPASERWGIA